MIANQNPGVLAGASKIWHGVILMLSAGLVSFLCLFHAVRAEALTADQLLVVTNRRVPAGDQLGEYYMKRRSVPAKNLVRLDAPASRI